MTEPDEQPRQTNEQLWKLTIDVEAEVIPGDPEEAK